jgi:hypothetical protein
LLRSAREQWTDQAMQRTKGKKFSSHTATLLADGQIEVDGVAYSGPSEAATTIAGKRTNGWWFFLTEQSTRRSLRNVRRDYLDAMAVEAEDDEGDDEEDDEEG